MIEARQVSKLFGREEEVYALANCRCGSTRGSSSSSARTGEDVTLLRLLLRQDVWSRGYVAGGRNLQELGFQQGPVLRMRRGDCGLRVPGLQAAPEQDR